MSETTYRPRVRVISNAAALAIASAGGVALSALLTAVIKELSPGAQRTFRDLSVAPVDSAPVLQSSTALRKLCALTKAQQDRLKSERTLSELETRKVAAILRLQAAPFFVKHRAVDENLRAMCFATSQKVLARVQAELFGSVITTHQGLMTEAITSACCRAAGKAGFDQLRINRSDPNVIRVIAKDCGGRYLVTEIESGDSDCEPTLSTEVVNARDGSCHAILDSFERALEIEGIRSAIPTRKSTSGICELRTSKELMSQVIDHDVCTPKNGTAFANVAESSATRRRRLNQPTRLKQR